MTFLSLVAAATCQISPIVSSQILTPPSEAFDCHSSSIAESQHTLNVVWKGGPGPGLSNRDMQRNVGVWQARCEQESWSTPLCIVECPDSIVWNPILCSYGDELLLFYRVGPTPRAVTGYLKRSQDGGRTWGAAEQLPSGTLGPTASSPLIDTEGTIIAGSSSEVGEPSDSVKTTACWVERSCDGGHSWTRFGPLRIEGAPFGALEPSLFLDSVGNLRMLCRDRAHRIGKTGFVHTATSTDGGKTWSPLVATSLPNPDSRVIAIGAGHGKLLAIYNDSHEIRAPLSIAVSLDGGESWIHALILEETSGEFPAAVLSSDRLVHITYAFCPEGRIQRLIKHVVLDPEKLSLTTSRGS